MFITGTVRLGCHGHPRESEVGDRDKEQRDEYPLGTSD